MTLNTVNIKTLLAQAELPDAEQPQYEAQLLLCEVLACRRAQLFTDADKPLTPQQISSFQQLLQRRQQGEPIAYILSHQGFWNLDLTVTPDTLIPRPETEMLVEAALTHLPKEIATTVLDLGTGSGAIALAIAKERPQCQVTAVDQSTDTLAVAEINRQRAQLQNVTLLKSDWFGILAAQRFEVIVSNPPYICANDPHLQQGDLRFEPQQALVAGEDGLDALRIIIQQAPAHLQPNGCLLVEHGYDQASLVQELFQNAGFKQINTRQDLNKLDRITSGQM